ncbi:unnamed protein product [Phyllotreta striolata]|uniref:Rho-GAP domain-containing protein n=1 Tax=Phyllotreta striolata TaxID=444603 RepID=A0A9P0DRV8_PHYSR|nr:unnamed protein product [Phyllotreta striolata]
MKKQFFRVKQLTEQTFLKAEKSEIFNHEELQIADQKVEFLRGALSAIAKKIIPNGTPTDVEKLKKKTIEYHLGTTLLEESRQPQSRECPLMHTILRECGQLEQQLGGEYADHELKVEELVYSPLQYVLENDFPNILKHKHNLRKYCLDKDSASNRYQASGKEALRGDMEEADTKVEQSRDALAIEMFSLLAKENELSEYILQLLKIQRSYHESALKNLLELIPVLEKKIGDSSVRKVFGTSLREHLRVTNKRIAYPLEICISALTEYGLSEEGLFRVAASTSKVKRLKAAIDSGCFSFLIPEYRDVHILSSLLKLYLRELPEPLLTFHLHECWLEAVQVQEPQRIDKVKEIIQRLPQENRDNLAYLFQFLSKLTKHPENKMTPSNIAIVLSPNLLWNEQENLNSIGSCVTFNILVELMIKESDYLFPDDASKLVSALDIFQDEDIGSFKTSNSHLDYYADGPRPNQRKKKTAPVPPLYKSDKHDSVTKMTPSSPKNSIKLDEIKVIHNPPHQTTPPHVPANSPVAKPKPDESPAKPPPTGGGSAAAAAASREKEPAAKLVQVKSHPVALPRQIEPAKKPPSPNTKDGASQTLHKSDRSTMTDESKGVAQTKPAEPKFVSTIYHKISNHPAVITDNKSLDDIEEVSIRRKDLGARPEIPARPSSLRTCSVYNVANKQQPSYVHIQVKPEPPPPHQPGHDNKMAEKERFLGHKADEIDSNHNSDGHTADRTLLVKPLDCDREGEMAKSVDSIVKNNDACDMRNANRKSSHNRTRSDGGIIDVNKGTNTGRNLSKPTQPPPPPPDMM